MAINTKSIRTKLLGLLAGIALVVGGVSVLYDLVAGESLIRDQIVKRGRYVASNLAFNAKYGVLTEDKPLLTQFLEGAVAAGGDGEHSDVVGAMIRDAKGSHPRPDRQGPPRPAGGAPGRARGAGGVHDRRRAGDPLPRPRDQLERRLRHGRGARGCPRRRARRP